MVLINIRSFMNPEKAVLLSPHFKRGLCLSERICVGQWEGSEESIRGENFFAYPITHTHAYTQ